MENQITSQSADSVQRDASSKPKLPHECEEALINKFREEVHHLRDGEAIFNYLMTMNSGNHWFCKGNTVKRVLHAVIIN